jgi:hypothetical protein
MEWKGATEEDRRMLKRVVALLVAFAGLAERLGDLPYPARGFVHWFLRFAETVARDFAIETAVQQGAPDGLAFLPIPALHRADNSADAMRLARSFRALAVLLDRFMDRTPGRRDLCHTGATSGRQHLPGEMRFAQLCLAPAGFAVGCRDP